MREHFAGNTWQGEGAAKQDEHDEVGEEGGEPDDLAGGVETLGDDEVDDDPGDHQAAGELPLHSSKAVLQTRVLLQNTVPGIKSLEGSIICSGYAIYKTKTLLSQDRKSVV